MSGGGGPGTPVGLVDAKEKVMSAGKNLKVRGQAKRCLRLLSL